MFFHEIQQFIVRNSFLAASFLIAISNTVKIESMLVPEVIQAGNTSDVVLDCVFTGASDQVTVQWLFNDKETPVYQWSPRKEPQVNSVLDGHLDLTFKVSSLATEERRALHLINLEPELSGEYTCRVLDQGAEARQTKTLLIYSPEKEFLLELIRHNHEVEIKCTARGLYPQPELTLEHNGVMFPKQQQRMWRNEGLLYDTENTARLTIPKAPQIKPEQITCRLQLPQAGYTAIKKELLYIEKDCTNKSSKATVSTIYLFMSLVMHLAQNKLKHKIAVEYM